MLVLGGVVLALLIWQFGTALWRGRAKSNAAVQHFHQELNVGSYDQIANEADEGFEREGKRDELVRFLQTVHTKLGPAGDASMTSININVSTKGTFTTAGYLTQFGNDKAQETFIWKKSADGELKLYRYNIQSNQLAPH
jgi:hypothetical protein